MDKLNHAKYSEFSANIVAEIPVMMSEFLDELSSGLEGDIHAKQDLQEVNMTRMNEFMEKFEAKVATMPTFYSANIPQDEKDFYDFLIQSNQPYRPYIPSEE